MLVLGLKLHEHVVLRLKGKEIGRITLTESGTRRRIGIQAPAEVSIEREGKPPIEKDVEIHGDRRSWQNSWETKAIQMQDIIDRQAEELKAKDEKIEDMAERLETIVDLAGMYIKLIGTDKECPWVRSMGSIHCQAEAGLKGKD